MSEQRDYWTPPRFWEGETVLILGGGPSLKEVNLEPLKVFRTIGVNQAWKLGDWIELIIFGDVKWWRWTVLNGGKNREEFFKHPSIKVTNCEWFYSHKMKPKGIKVMGRPGTAWTKKPGFLGWPLNTGGAAINLAGIVGAKRVLLVGFDGKAGGEEGNNWHDDYPEKLPDPKGTYSIYKSPMKKLYDAATRDGVEVINCTPNSGYNFIPYKPIEEFL
jgi:hypothetical protein